MSASPRTDAYAQSNPAAERWEWIAKCEEFEIELAAALEHIKRLEEAGDELEAFCSAEGALRKWRAAKEAK